MRARRAVAVGAAALAVTFGASACDSSPVAASVNGTEIKQAQVRTIMREFASSPNFVAAYDQANAEQQTPSGQQVIHPANFTPNVQGSAPGTFSATFTNFVLGSMIAGEVVHQRIVSQHITVSPGALAASRAFFELSYPGWFQFSPSLRDLLVRWRAESATVEPPADDLTAAEADFSEAQPYFFQQVCVRQVSVVAYNDQGAVDDDASLMRANQLEAADFSGGGSSSTPAPSSTTTTPTTAPAIGATPTSSTTSAPAASSTTSSTTSTSSASSTSTSSTSSSITVPSSTTTTAPASTSTTSPGIGQSSPSSTSPATTTPAPGATTSTTVPAPGSGTPQQAGGSIVCYTPTQLEQQGVAFFQKVLGLAPGQAAPPEKNRDGGYTIVAVDSRKLLPFDAGAGQVIAVLTDQTGALNQNEPRLLAAARVHVNPGFGTWDAQQVASTGDGLVQPRLPSNINSDFGYSLTGS